MFYSKQLKMQTHQYQWHC